MKIRYKIISYSALVCMALYIIGVIIFYTDFGLRWTLTVANAFIPGKLIAQGVHGKLAQQVTIANLSYQNPELKITAHNINLSWQPFALLRKKLIIKQLTAANIIITTQSASLKPIVIRQLSAKLSTTGKRIDVIDIDLQAQNAQLTVTGKYDHQYNIKWQLAIQKLNDFLLTIKGSLQGQGQISGPQFSPRLTAVMQARQLQFGSDLLDKANLTAKLQAQLTRQGMQAQAIIIPQYQPAIHAQVLLDQHDNLRGQVTWHTNRLQILKLFIPYIVNINGILDINFKLGGTLNDPHLIGQATLRNGSAYMPLLNLTLRNIQLAARGNLAELDYQGQIYAGPGYLKANGKTLLKTGYPSVLNVTGKNFLISNRNTVKIYVTPDLKLVFANHRLDIEGTTTIPQAQIQPHDFRTTETLPDDVVFVDQKKQEETLPLVFYSRIKLVLGQHVYLNVKGIKGYLAGHVTIINKPKTITTAQGLLVMQEGSYDLLGQELSIKHSKLIFKGPLVNPQLDVTASRKIQIAGAADLVVGLHLIGTIEKPRGELFSDPSGLSQEDILSYLLFGQPVGQIGQNNAALLVHAASMLDLAGAGKFTELADALQRKFGLSEFGLGARITPEDEEVTPAFVIGKYLLSNLYVGYSVGLLDPVNIFRLRYNITGNWAVQSESSSLGSGIDLLYNIKKK